jgi:hypothetical protein
MRNPARSNTTAGTIRTNCMMPWQRKDGHRICMMNMRGRLTDTLMVFFTEDLLPLAAEHP